MDKYELINSIIAQLNKSVGMLVSGQYIAWMNAQTEIVSKLVALKEGLHNEDKGGDN